MCIELTKHIGHATEVVKEYNESTNKTENVDKVETLAIERAKQLFDAKFVLRSSYTTKYISIIT